VLANAGPDLIVQQASIGKAMRHCSTPNCAPGGCRFPVLANGASQS
jgi:hypothetical protein